MNQTTQIKKSDLLHFFLDPEIKAKDFCSRYESRGKTLTVAQLKVLLERIGLKLEDRPKPSKGPAFDILDDDIQDEIETVQTVETVVNNPDETGLIVDEFQTINLPV